MTRLICSTWQAVAPQLPRLQQLRHLELSEDVQVCIDRLLPRSLTSLQLAYCYAPLSSTTFPPSLTEMHLSGQDIENISPPSDSQPVLVSGCLPHSLEQLYYDANNAVIPCGALPPSLRLLYLGQGLEPCTIGLQPGCLPASLTELR